jgi:hypothetical protein
MFASTTSLEVDTDNDFHTLKEQKRLADAANFCVADVRVKFQVAEEAGEAAQQVGGPTIMHPGIGCGLRRTQHIELRSEKYLAAANALESDIADLKEFQELCRPTKPTTELERRDPNREEYLRFWRSTAGEMVKMRDTMKYLRRCARMSQEHGR